MSVSELTGKIRSLLERQLGQVWVTGEITNFRAQSSGHMYFTLKDAGAQLSCVLFRGETGVRREHVADGRKVNLRGEVTVYEQRGQYQLRVLEVELQGIGALQAAFEKLKEKLSQEGLFALERKRPLPRFPARIGLITSPTGAAIRDVCHVIGRRHPGLEIILVPVAVQGAGAAGEIAAALGRLNEFHLRGGGGLDLILLTRGGGSLEDLWAFNEEVVARAIFHSTVPVVSGVGHEIDFTIADFVADVRAATPSAAAEIITEGVFSSCKFITEISGWLRQQAGRQLERKREAAGQFAQRVQRRHPRRELQERWQHIDELRTSLQRCGQHDLERQRRAVRHLSERLMRLRPGQVLRQRGQILQLETQRLQAVVGRRMEECRRRAEHLARQLKLLSPEQVLARGYSITTDAGTGRVVRVAGDVSAGARLRTRLGDGELISRVERD